MTGRARSRSSNSQDRYDTSGNQFATLHTLLMMSQGISVDIVVGTERRMLITLALDLYNRGLRLQQSVGNNNWILRAGVLYIAFAAALQALGKTIDGSGIDICVIEYGTYTSAVRRGIYGGKAYTPGIGTTSQLVWPPW